MFILWVFRFISKMSQESQVNLNFVDYALLCLRLFAISISPQSEERQVWPVGCLRAGCKIGRHQKWQRRLILKNQTLCILELNTDKRTDYIFDNLELHTDRQTDRLFCTVELHIDKWTDRQTSLFII